MSVKKIFVGSSAAARSQAKAVVEELSSPAVSFLPWWTAFTPGRTLLEELDVIRAKVDGVVLILSPESKSVIRGRLQNVPNLNVLFEFGYFYGCLGKTRVGAIKYGSVYLPSDLGGYIHISGDKTFRRGRALKVGARTVTSFNRWLAAF